MKTNEIIVEVKAKVNPTEDQEKVLSAVNRVFGDLKLELKEENDERFLYGKTGGIEALRKFYDLLRRERILGAARKVLFKSLSGKTMTFYLNKQVAFVGHISFSLAEKESPLGPIMVRISYENPRELIDWLAPRTA